MEADNVGPLRVYIWHAGHFTWRFGDLGCYVHFQMDFSTKCANPIGHPVRPTCQEERLPYWATTKKFFTGNGFSVLRYLRIGKVGEIRHREMEPGKKIREVFWLFSVVLLIFQFQVYFSTFFVLHVSPSLSGLVRICFAGKSRQ